jgi:hypothetical protein
MRKEVLHAEYLAPDLQGEVSPEAGQGQAKQEREAKLTARPGGSHTPTVSHSEIEPPCKAILSSNWRRIESVTV